MWDCWAGHGAQHTTECELQVSLRPTTWLGPSKMQHLGAGHLPCSKAASQAALRVHEVPTVPSRCVCSESTAQGQLPLGWGDMGDHAPLASGPPVVSACGVPQGSWRVD